MFLKNLDEEYQLSIFKGVKAEAAVLGLDLICIQGELLQHSQRTLRIRDSLGTKFPEYRSTDLFPSRHFIGADGILFLSSVLFELPKLDYADQLKNMFTNIPFVSVGNSFFGYHSIQINAEKPLWDLMDHLIVFHKYRKFLFISGPIDGEDNIIREKIFREAIEKYRLIYPDLKETVINGDFLETSGRIIARDYMNQHSDDPPDVIVAANDYMAIGARDMLMAREDPRWSKCPVTGFDDISQSGQVTPVLTTIRQPLEKLGKLAVRTLWDLIRGKDVPLTIKVDATLIIRSSCGCPGISRAKPGQQTMYRSLYHLRYLSELGQSFAAINTFEEMFTPLRFFLTSLAVSLFFLIVYKRPQPDIATEGKLIYEQTPEKEHFGLENVPEINIKEFIKNLSFMETSSPAPVESTLTGASRAWCLSHLRSGNEYLGMVIYEAQDTIHPQLYNGLILLANTVKRLFSYQEEMDRAVQLEHEVAYRTRDLLEANKKLREEVQRRMEAEAEVLQISEMERRRFSMDLHDDICQRLAGISMYSKSLTAGKKESRQIAVLKELSALIDETLLRTRQYAHDSFPMDLGTMGLRDSLDMLCSVINKQTHCKCIYSWTTGNEYPLSQSQDLNVYRIIQEAIQNAVKHAKANRIAVEIHCDESWFTASVQDNGTGNPMLNDTGSEGLGLRSMRYRAHQAGADYFFNSQEIGGTIVRIRIPVSANI